MLSPVRLSVTRVDPSPFASPRPKYGTRYLLTSANSKHTLLSEVLLSLNLLSLAAPIMHLDSFLSLWRYINLLLTYLLNCLILFKSDDSGTKL